MKRLFARAGKPDYTMIVTMTILILFGLVMLGSASFDIAENRFGDAFYYLKQQLLIGVGGGLVLFLITSKINYKVYKKGAIAFLFISLGLIGLLYSPLGVEVGNAVRAVQIGPVSFQPGEFLKITFIIYLTAWMSQKVKRQRTIKEGLIPFLLLTGVVAVPLLFQRTTSLTAILIFTAFVAYFSSGAKIRYIITIIALGIAVLTGISLATEYRRDRVLNFFNQGENLETTGFHLNQSKIAIGTGGLTGVGFGESAAKVNYLPEVLGDSIFAIIAEEMGFIVTAMLLVVYFIFIMRFFILARKVRNKFGQLLLISFGTLIAAQTFINIGATSGLIPLTGAPLPFISFGKSAMVTFMTITGISVNISKFT
jgi:cell division protein FtsW